MADLEELMRQDVEEESAEELLGGERAGLLAAGTEDDLVVGDRQQARRRDADAVGVAAEIVDDLRGTTEGLLGEDDPVVLLGLAHERGEIGLAEIDLAGLPEVDEPVRGTCHERLSRRR